MEDGKKSALTLDTATGQLGFFGEEDEYRKFEEKFQVKKTTDDCYTPENVYEAVAEWVRREYGVDRDRMLRPFWPGKDYQAEEYPEGCVVVDNPPFSIRSQIIDWYCRKGIRFFLFSPALTLLVRNGWKVCHIAVGVTITYGNEAQVPTSFVTNLEDCAMRTAPELYRAVKAADDANRRENTGPLPKYSYPDEIVTAAIAQRWCQYGVTWRVGWEDAVQIRALDAQKAADKHVFGGGLFLSERAAAEKAAAEKAAAENGATQVWRLSDREKALSAALGKERP